MNEVVVITGASSGLGLSLSKKFNASGSTVIGISRTKKNWKSALTILSPSKTFLLFQCDLSKEHEVRKLVAKINKRFCKIDLWINNAGYGGMLSRVEDISLSELKKHFSVNLCSVFFTSKYVIPLFRKQGKGQIINISSMAGKRAVPKLAAYSASKFGVIALSQCVAKENNAIKCITICPGGMNTQMRASLFGSADASRQQSPDFVADVIHQVAKDEIKVDSGGDVVIRHGQVTVNPVPAA